MTAVIRPPQSFLENAAYIDEILTPLKRFGITTLSLSRVYLDYTQIYLSNNPAWVADYYQHQFYGNFISCPLASYTSGVLAWPQNSPMEVFKLARERYDSDNGITLIKKQLEFTDFYFFSGSTSNTELIHFYHNHLEIMETFIRYFQDRASKILKQATKHRVQLPSGNFIEPATGAINDPFDSNEIHASLYEMHLSKYYLQHPDHTGIKLSGRELDCIFALNKGYSAKSIAKSLNLSNRTVETYIDSVRNKLSCNSKHDILDILREDGLLK